jgi:spore coat polysaccharide biosynthesis protein SpsF
MGSTRFPGKVMELIDGINPAIYYTINQLKESKFLENIIIATTKNIEDDEIVKFSKKLNIKTFRGDSSDVLARYYHCAKSFSLSSILRVTADCPLIDPLIVDKGISKFLENKYDYVTNTFPRSFPDGNETEIFSFSALELAYKNSILPSEREHVTPYFRNNKEKFKIYNFNYSQNISNLRWTLDYKVDLKLIKIIISKITKRPIHLEDILKLLKNEPDLIKINENYKPNEGYFKSLKEDKEFLERK